MQPNRIGHAFAKPSVTFSEIRNLPNRLSLNGLMQDAMLCSRNRSYTLTICFLDLDGFKDINDRFGHHALG